MNYSRIFIRNLFLVIVALSLQQCKLYKTPPPTEALSKESLPEKFDIPEYWNSTQIDTAEVVDDWYTTFNDTDLNNLVMEALDSTNLPIIFHLARIDASLAQKKLAKSRNSVQAGYNGSYTGYSDTKSNNDYNFTAAGGITWEADLWGKIEASILTADENILNEIYNYDYTRQSIAANVTSLYFNIGTTNQILELGNTFLELNEYLVNILEEREKVGIISMKDVHLSQGQIFSVKKIIEENKDLLQQNVRSLELLLGRYPENKLNVNWAPDSLETISQVSNPLSIIQRRPDIKASEANVRARFYINEQAQLAKYPDLVLSADLGISTIGALIFGTGASLLGPIFNGGAIDAQIEEATAIQKQAAVDYGLSIMNAFNEVESLMQSELILKEQLKFALANIDEIEKAYEIVLKQYAVGQIDLFEAVLLQSQWLLKEIELLKTKNNIYQTRVQLYLALGGNISN